LSEVEEFLYVGKRGAEEAVDDGDVEVKNTFPFSPPKGFSHRDVEASIDGLYSASIFVLIFPTSCSSPKGKID